MIQAPNIGEALQALTSTVGLLGVVVGVGMMIQNLRNIASTVEKIERRLDAHIDDSTVHAPVSSWERRIERLEDRE